MRGNALLIGRDDLTQILWVHARGQCRRTDKVREHHRDVPALGGFLRCNDCRGLVGGLRGALSFRLDRNPQAMRQRRETVQPPFGTLKMRMGETHFLMKRLPKVATEMALHVLAYNLTRIMNIMGCRPLVAAMRA
jgi:hypothetical protein